MHRLRQGLAIGLLGLLFGALGSMGVAAAAAPDGCEQAVALVAKGQLSDALTLAGVVGPGCAAEVATEAATARDQATRIAQQAALTGDIAEKARLKQLALSVDDANPTAKAITITPTDASLCAAADRQLAAGQLTRAKALYDALKDTDSAKDCRAKGLADLTASEEAQPGTILRDFITGDLLITGLAALVAFMVGVALAAWFRFSYPLTVAIAMGATSLVGLIVWRWFAMTHTGWFVWLSLVCLLLLTAVTGLALSSSVRSAKAMRITIAPDASKDLGARVLDEIYSLVGAAPHGVFAVQGTDVADTAFKPILDAAKNPLLSLAVGLWNLVTLGGGDGIDVMLSGESGKVRVATVTLRKGRRVSRSTSVDGAGFCVDRASPTPAELAAADADICTAIASEVLLWRQAEVNGTEPPARLYGAAVASSVALTAVAGRRQAGGDPAAAQLLYARAVLEDPPNRMAQFGGIVASLRDFPSPRVANIRITQLRELMAKERLESPGGSPLLWRIEYNLAAAQVNAALDGRTGSDLFARGNVRDAFARSARLLKDLAASPQPPEGSPDRALWGTMRALAVHTRKGLHLTLAPDLVKKELVKVDLTSGPTVQYNIACGLAVCYARTTTGRVKAHTAELIVDRLRLAATNAPTQAAVFKDPFIALAAGSRALKDLQREWGAGSSTPYDGVESIGKLAGRLVARFPTAATLALALQVPGSEALLAADMEVDLACVGAWRGAAQWLSVGQPAERVNLCQRAGFRDRLALVGIPDAQVAARLAAVAAVTGWAVPSDAQRAALSG